MRNEPVPDSYEMPLWRALVVYRLAALAYATFLMATNFGGYAHPVAGWSVIAVMAGWTLVTAVAYAHPRRPRWPLLAADLAVAAGCLLVSPWVIGVGTPHAAVATVPASWVAGAMLAWAISGGRIRGVVAAAVLGCCDVLARGHGVVNQLTLSDAMLLLLAGLVVGHVARLAVQTQQRLRRAVELEAATRERERLARDIHDSVLQVLALMARRGTELGGEAAEIGRLAAEQELALRTLVGVGSLEPPPVPAGEEGVAVDLRALLAPYASATVSLATPADPVPVAPGPAAQIAAAVGAALSNVHRHGGPSARAWVLVEEDDDAVSVSVRDDGAGFVAGRLAEAAAAGRLGVAQSICGRIRELGGTATVASEPGSGTEVELRVPRGRLA